MTFLFSDSESVAKARNYNMGSAGGQGGGVSGNAAFCNAEGESGEPSPRGRGDLLFIGKIEAS